MATSTRANRQDPAVIPAADLSPLGHRGLIQPIVEGHAEVQSVPTLLRRLFAELLRRYDVDVARPYRVGRNQIVQSGELEEVVSQLRKGMPRVGAVLVLIDADDDDPGHLAQELERRARAATDLPVAVVAANREFEAWFLGAKESLRGVRGIRQDASAPADPESIRDAKGRLSRNMRPDRYVEVDDQAALAASVDLGLARQRCPSFDKLVREVERLLSEMKP